MVRLKPLARTLGTVVLVLFAIRRRRDRRKLALLRQNEPPDEPAYWVQMDGGGDGDGDGVGRGRPGT